MVFIPNLGAFHKLIIEASQNKGGVRWEILSVSHFHTLIFMPSASGLFLPPSLFSKCAIVNSRLFSSAEFDLSTSAITTVGKNLTLWNRF